MKQVTRYFSAIFAVVLAFITVGCKPYASEDDYAAKGGKVKIGVCIHGSNDPYIVSVRRAIESAAKDANVELTVYDSKNDQTTQNEQIDSLIKKGVQALAIDMVESGEAENIIAKANVADIPVVFFNKEPAAGIMKPYGQTRYVGTKPEEAGIIQAETIINILEKGNYDTNGDGKIQYVILTGDPQDPESNAITQNCVDTLGRRGIKLDLLAEGIAHMDYDEAKSVTDEWGYRPGFDSIELIIANNDAMAAGAIASLQESEYNLGTGGNYIPVFGVDATDEAVELISKGYMAGTVKRDAVTMGDAVFALTKNAAEGKDFLANTRYTFDESGLAVRIPYQLFMGGSQWQQYTHPSS